MTRTHIATAATIVCVPIVALQFFQNSKLKQEIGGLQSEVVRLGGSASNGGDLSALTPKQRKAEQEKAKAAADAAAEKEAILAASGSSLIEILAERDPLVRLHALLDYVDGISADQIPVVLAKLRGSTPDWDPEARMAAHLMLTRWGKTDPDAAFAYVASLDYKKGGGDAAVVLGALAAQDPRRAVEWLSDPDNKLGHLPWMGDILAGTIGKEWVRQDPGAALAWAQTLPDNQRSGALAGVLQSIAATNPQRASALAMQLDSSKEKTEVIGQIAESWAEHAPQQALDWALALQGEDRKRAVGEALGGWAQTSPDRAAAYVDDLPAGERGDNLIKQVASTWARQAPADAAEWVGAQPEGAGKAGAMGDVMWNWTVADPQAASAWLAEQPVGPSRDAGIGSLAKATFDTDPAAAVSWAATMSDERGRKGALQVGVRVWRERDPKAARDWIESSDLISDAEAQDFLAESEDKK